MEPSATDNPPPRPLREIAIAFTRLGFTAFGGPAAHVALMEDEFVHRRRWLSRQHFLDLVATLNFIPGPNSTELAIHLGLIRAGWRGLVVAGVCFITPAMLIILPIAWMYVRFAGAGVQPPAAVLAALQGIGAVVVAILAITAFRLAHTAVTTRRAVVIALLTLPAELLIRRYTLLQSEIVILAAAAVVGAVGAVAASRRVPPATTLAIIPQTVGAIASAFGPVVTGVKSTLQWIAAAMTLGPAGTEFLRLAWYFLTVGGTLFGSGYVLVNYLETGLLQQHGWLTHRQVADAVAVGQVTPGPLLTTATFAGYVRGHAITGTDAGGLTGAVVSTVAIFLPAFVLVALFGRVLPILRAKPWARGALDAMNAAVVMLLIIVTVRFAIAALLPDGTIAVIPCLLFAGSLSMMLRWGVNSAILIATGALVGTLSSTF
ncbi:chromate efflux transporter [Humisphaera borealis]|uniref:Chromate efflux transporter n=1 Tax=Humisphaera borealis TaxID=2807512 RepID=A0A7M2X182_9BACT|nr:chromate efflux transporter [Humisphaera borealis]QOV91496.1 chromate efflux transporter [Humisphaera borealis]